MYDYTDAIITCTIWLAALLAIALPAAVVAKYFDWKSEQAYQSEVIEAKRWNRRYYDAIDERLYIGRLTSERYWNKVFGSNATYRAEARAARDQLRELMAEEATEQYIADRGDLFSN